MSNKLLHTDTLSTGALLTLALVTIGAAIVWGILTLLGLPLYTEVRWLFAAFVAPILLIRFYAKSKQATALKGAIIAFFVLVIAFFILFGKQMLTDPAQVL